MLFLTCLLIYPNGCPFFAVPTSEIDLSSPLNYGTPSSRGAPGTPMTPGVGATPIRQRPDVRSDRKIRQVAVGATDPVVRHIKMTHMQTIVVDNWQVRQKL